MRLGLCHSPAGWLWGHRSLFGRLQFPQSIGTGGPLGGGAGSPIGVTRPPPPVAAGLCRPLAVLGGNASPLPQSRRADWDSLPGHAGGGALSAAADDQLHG